MSQSGVKIIYIKKKAKHAAHHGGAWKVAYADFVTAMMALFIVLWLLTQSDQASKERIAQYFRTGILPGGSIMLGSPAGSNPPLAINIFPHGHPPNSVSESEVHEALRKQAQQLLKEAAAEPGLAPIGEHVKIHLVDEGTLIELIEGRDNFLFGIASSELKPGAIQFLQRLAPLLAALPNKVEIHGHTDARAFDPRSGRNNWDLSYERADRARQVLEGSGLPSGKITGVLAHADSMPWKPENPYAPENRRLAILIVRTGWEQDRAGAPPDVKKRTGPIEGPLSSNAASGMGAGRHDATSTTVGGEEHGVWGR